MSQSSVAFFELLADSSVFTAAFAKAKTQAQEFAASFNVSAAEVEVSANKMGIAIERGIATGSLSRASANQMINSRLSFYGAGTGAAVGAEASAAGGGGLGGLLGAAGLITAIVAPIGMLVDGLLRGEEAFASESSTILRNSEAIGMNAQQLQTWDAIAKIVGLDSQSMQMDFERFAKNLEEGAPALKATGFTLTDLGITSKDVGTAMLQLADYFHAHSDQAQKAAIATALFGRSGAELIPILDQGSGAFQNYEAQLQKMGVLLSDSNLFIGAQAQTATTQFGQAFESAKDRLLVAALPGFTAFFQYLSQLLESNGQVWTDIGHVISEQVSFIIGVIAGLTGSNVDITKTATDAGAAYQGLGGAVQDAQAGMGSAAGATKSLTDALQDQISTLQEQKRAQDEVFDAQKAAYQDQLDTLHDVTDTRRRQGEDIVTYERRLNELGIQDKIKAIDKAKTAYDRQVDDHIAALQREKQAVSEAGGAMGASLASGLQSGFKAGTAAAHAATLQIDQDFVNLGKDLGQWLTEFFKHPKQSLTDAANEFGQLMGTAIVKGAESEFGRQMAAWLVGPGATWAHNQMSGGDVGSGAAGAFGMIQMSSGGLNLSEGVRYLHPNELVLPLSDPGRSLALMESSGVAAMARGAGGGGGGLTVNFYGPVADEMVASRVINQLDREMRKRGFSGQRGFGSG